MTEKLDVPKSSLQAELILRELLRKNGWQPIEDETCQPGGGNKSCS